MGNSSVCCQDETNSFNITDIDFKQISHQPSKKILISSKDIQTQIEESPSFSKEQIFQVHQMLREQNDKIQNTFKQNLSNLSLNQDDDSLNYVLKSNQISSLPYLQSLASSHGLNSKNCSPRDSRPEMRKNDSNGSTSKKQNMKKQVFFNNQDDFLNYTRLDCQTPKMLSKCENYIEYDNQTTRTDVLKFSDKKVSIKLNDIECIGNTYNKRKDRSQFYKPKITVPQNGILGATSFHSQSKLLFSDSDLNELSENQSFSEIDSLDSSYNKIGSNKSLTLNHLQDNHDFNIIRNKNQLNYNSQIIQDSIFSDKYDQISNQNLDLYQEANIVRVSQN
ncbi:UNKNOWN [Stylonychia lemnae]|uniref:Uncharacterized protein n=1 Tax=Stylonychia lemnae TaxID=5949 RepID=A0A077ZTF3_STYLE|nr:UNKNOWN [Stylonychia lemnae]|eukprot:CDW71741.1 UNKNOWN [Stylonychia lemnae]